MLSLILLLAVPAIRSTGLAVQSTAGSVTAATDGARGSVGARPSSFFRPVIGVNNTGYTSGNSPGTETSGPGDNNNQLTGGGTESNSGGIEKRRELPLSNEVYW